MIKSLTTSLLLLLLLTGCQSETTPETPTPEKPAQPTELTLGTKLSIHSNNLNENRPIIISLPKDYATSKAHYPVLYLTDGLQNIWHVMGTIEVLSRTGSVPPMIVVGIESKDRIRDFTLTTSENHPGSGGGKKFLNFIESELIPYVDSHYRTNSFKVLEGHSLGGLFAASTLLEKPNLFDGFIIMSPALWWNGEALTQTAEPFFKNHPDLDKALFFGIGTYESGTDYGMRKELKNFVDVLEQNRPKNVRFQRKEMEQEGHMSSTLLSNYYGLKFIFSDMKFPKTFYDAYSDAAFLEHENAIMAKYGAAAKQSAELYVSLASMLRQETRYSEAITVLKRSVEAYPFDVGLMNFLGNTYELDHNTEGAIQTYKQAIATSKRYHYNREEEFEAQIERLTKK